VNPCISCGSYAINPGQRGRGADNAELCDICYWRARVVRLEEFVKKTEVAFDDIGAVNWSRRARRALEEK